MLKSPDESEYPQKPPENSEAKPRREIFKEIARTQMDCLGYSTLVKDLTEFFKGQGAITELEQQLPSISDGNHTYIHHIVDQMKRIPNSNQASRLLITAIFGEPARRDYDGTIVVTSFSVAEPSTTIVQTKFRMLKDSEDNPKYAANKKGTDELAQKLISDSGFLPRDKTAETIYDLRKGGSVSLTHPTIDSLKMDLSRPKDFEERSQSPTAYSYNVQTTLSPSI